MWQLSVLLGLTLTNFGLAAPQVETLSTTDGSPTSTEKSGCGLYGPHDVDDQQQIDFTNDVARYGELPWMVMLLKKKWVRHANRYISKNVHFCHGVLINNKAVLVAVHCVNRMNPNDIIVRVGEWDTNDVNNESHPTQDRKVSEIIYHDEVNLWNREHVFAIIILSSPIEFGKNVNTVCLLRAENEYNASQCIVSGWCREVHDSPASTDSGKLKRVKLPDVSYYSLPNTYSKSFGFPSVSEIGMIRAGTRGDPDMCQDKTGRPLICPLVNDTSRYVLIGLEDFRSGWTSDPYSPSLFVKVLPARTWIDEKISEKQLDTSAYTYGP